MKVRKFLNKLNLSSNCLIYLHDCETGKEYRIYYHEIRIGVYGQFDNFMVNSFTINENRLTVYAEHN